MPTNKTYLFLAFSRMRTMKSTKKRKRKHSHTSNANNNTQKNSGSDIRKLVKTSDMATPLQRQQQQPQQHIFDDERIFLHCHL